MASIKALLLSLSQKACINIYADATPEDRTRSGALLGGIQSGQRLHDKHRNVLKFKREENLNKKIKGDKKTTPS